MNRIVTITIDKKDYPLLFSILAMEEIYDRYGSLEAMMKVVFDSPNVAKQTREILTIAEILNKAACACLSEKSNEKRLNVNSILATANPYDLLNMNLWQIVLNAINKGAEQTVEVVDDSKNAEATQG